MSVIEFPGWWSRPRCFRPDTRRPGVVTLRRSTFPGWCLEGASDGSAARFRSGFRVPFERNARLSFRPSGHLFFIATSRQALPSSQGVLIGSQIWPYVPQQDEAHTNHTYAAIRPYVLLIVARRRT